jgi:hypothetical protein
MVGEVWVDSGQSNMEFSLRSANNGEAEAAAANHPNIRRIHVTKKVSAFPVSRSRRPPLGGVYPANRPGIFGGRVLFSPANWIRSLAFPSG